MIEDITNLAIDILAYAIYDFFGLVNPQWVHLRMVPS